ncbi:MAG: gliding motility-associated C-terminal domain-containing protein, partial [Gemmatimonadota bacterium]|nr:gliding motility-associated C-terminal domain-containing protein [Gemmatimonadota bacterium]
LPQDEDSGQMDFLEVRASPPVATQLVGEIWPVEVAVGQPQQFTYVLRPAIGADSGGFDRLEVSTVARLGSVTQVRIGDEPVSYAVEATEPHRVVVSIPRLTAQDSGALVEVVFEAEVLRYGSAFSMRVWDSALPLEVPQSVQEGDATPAYEDNRVWVATQAEHQGVLQMSRKPAVLTPNGDERNDEVSLEYQLVELTGRSRVAVAVWDLSGRRVRQVYEGLDGVGIYKRLWDGRDESDRLVPPGLYLYRVSVEADHQAVEQAGLLHVVY